MFNIMFRVRIRTVFWINVSVRASVKILFQFGVGLEWVRVTHSVDLGFKLG